MSGNKSPSCLPGNPGTIINAVVSHVLALLVFGLNKPLHTSYSTNFTAIKSYLMAPAFLSSDEVPTSADHADSKKSFKIDGRLSFTECHMIFIHSHIFLPLFQVTFNIYDKY
jgi:hypothetical protein